MSHYFDVPEVVEIASVPSFSSHCGVCKVCFQAPLTTGVFFLCLELLLLVYFCFHCEDEVYLEESPLK